jgi:hypothetical protein
MRDSLGGMHAMWLGSLWLILSAGFALPLPQERSHQATATVAGCYELRTPPGHGEVVFRLPPDSIRLDRHRVSYRPDEFRVIYIGRQPRSPAIRALRREVRWRPQEPDSAIIFAPLGMWMEQLRFRVDPSGTIHGRVLVYTDVVSPDDSTQVGLELTGARIRC